MSTKSTTRFGIKNFEAKFGKLTIGRLLEAYRRADELSLKEMANKLGMSPSSLCDLEKGRRIPTPKRAAELAKKLGTSEKYWVQISLQNQLDQQGFDLKVSVA
jgi:transcriptional regulator with XRE-family HTH domain